MNIYILQVLKKFFTLISIACISIVGNNNVVEKNIAIKDKSTIYTNYVEKYTTTYEYSDSLPASEEKIKQEGVNGLYYYNELKEKIIIRNVQEEIVLKGSGSTGYFRGWTTGYGPDCKTCSGGGNVSCRVNGKPFNLINDGVYYDDSEYGKVRVIAATKKVFPCGSIVYVDNKIQEPFYAIVLDRGSALEYSYNVNNTIHIDIAFKTQKDEEVWKATNTKNTAEFNVKRWGF